MKLTNSLDEALCGLLMMKMTANENHGQIQIKIKGSLFGEETKNEHQFYGAACLSMGNLLENSKGIIEVTLTLDELDITKGKVLFTVRENNNGFISATFDRWSLDCGDEEEADVEKT